jgi:hypothetical protein
MKKILCLAVVIFASAAVFAQEKTIQPAEFETISKSSSRLLSGAPRRIIRTQQSTIEIIPQTKDFNNSMKPAPPSTVSVKSVIEILPSVGYHSVYEFNSASKNTKKETIKMGNRTYEREGNAEWIEIAAPKASARTENTTRKIDNQVEYKILGSERVNNQNANIYAKIEKSKFVNSTDNQESTSSTTTKYWYAQDGRLLKRERIREIRSEKMISRFNSIIVFELDPNIKIEAPKLLAVK